MRFRNVTGASYNVDGTPAAGKTLRVVLEDNDFTLGGSIQKSEKKVVLDAKGFIPQSPLFMLWCNAEGFKGLPLTFYEPDGTFWGATLEYGDGSPISKEALRAGGRVVNPRSTTNSVIAALVEQKFSGVLGTSLIPTAFPEPANVVRSVNQKTPDGKGMVHFTLADFDLSGLEVFETNEAAREGGIGVGKLYRTATGDLKVTH